MNVNVRFKRLRDNAATPAYQTNGSAGADLSACLDGAIVIKPGEVAAVTTGIAIELPPDHAGFVFARSGLSTKRGLAPANMVGVIDADYRGEIIVALRNYGAAEQTVVPGERVAQLVVMPVSRAVFTEADDLTGTVRADGGFGSTGN